MAARYEKIAALCCLLAVGTFHIAFGYPPPTPTPRPTPTSQPTPTHTPTPVPTPTAIPGQPDAWANITISNSTIADVHSASACFDNLTGGWYHIIAGSHNDATLSFGVRYLPSGCDVINSCPCSTPESKSKTWCFDDPLWNGWQHPGADVKVNSCFPRDYPIQETVSFASFQLDGDCQGYNPPNLSINATVKVIGVHYTYPAPENIPKKQGDPAVDVTYSIQGPVQLATREDAVQLTVKDPPFIYWKTFPAGRQISHTYSWDGKLYLLGQEWLPPIYCSQDDVELWLRFYTREKVVTGNEWHYIETNVHQIVHPCADVDMEGVDDKYELLYGGFIPLNDDDDNQNSTPDRDETGPVVGEDELRRIGLSIDARSYEGVATLDVTGAGQVVRIWTDAQKGSGNEVTGFPKSYLRPEDVPDHLWVEGYSTGEASIVLTYGFLHYDDDAGKPQSKKRTDTLKVVVVDLDAQASDLYGNVSEAQEETPGAYVHYNVDNDDDSNNSVGAPKHPGGDYLEDGPIPSENDLRQLVISVMPALEKGTVVLKRSNGRARVWHDEEKGAGNKVLYDVDEKAWHLDVPGERQEFNTICNDLWVEGVGSGVCDITCDLKDPYGAVVCNDKIKYTFIAADCGNQPTTPEKASAEQAFANLEHCEWSITAGGTWAYNCIAWSVGITNTWIGAVGPPEYGDEFMDRDYGNNNGTLETSDVDAFYSAKGYIPTATGPSDADIMYYSGFHGAKKMGCACGAGRWIMFESKCGSWVRMEHVWDQLNGSAYGTPIRFYKHR